MRCARGVSFLFVLYLYSNSAIYTNYFCNFAQLFFRIRFIKARKTGAFSGRKNGISLYFPWVFQPNDRRGTRRFFRAILFRIGTKFSGRKRPHFRASSGLGMNHRIGYLWELFTDSGSILGQKSHFATSSVLHKHFCQFLGQTTKKKRFAAFLSKIPQSILYKLHKSLPLKKFDKCKSGQYNDLRFEANRLSGRKKAR